jgi:hypothetical protein
MFAPIDVNRKFTAVGTSVVVKKPRVASVECLFVPRNKAKTE